MNGRDIMPTQGPGGEIMATYRCKNPPIMATYRCKNPPIMEE
jgi:hypothetical protein